jgi:hypothetical protein
VTREPDSVNRCAPQDQLRAPARGGGDRLSVLVVALALIGAVGRCPLIVDTLIIGS